MPHLLLIHARFYNDLSEQLREGALAVVQGEGHSCDEANVPGALEIPQVMAYAIESGKYDGIVALGTVIRGETGHYDIVAGESARALMQLAIDFDMPLGNGILTVENEAQAIERAYVSRKNKGGEAARAALELIAIKQLMLA